jgi:phosphopantetheinyl transferase (holo-ACP synthase)
LTSIGNDIIALALINPEGTRKEKFFSKIICKQEAELFKSIDPSKLSFEHFIWLAWSIKESVYKFCSRNHSALLFSPTKTVIQTIQLPVNKCDPADEELESTSLDEAISYCCEVHFDRSKYFTRSIINNELIFSLCNNSDDFKNICWGIKKIDSDLYCHQSENVRAFALNKLKYITGEDELTFEKAEGGYPFIKQKKDIPVSFTHHSLFVGYAFALSPQTKIPHQ